MLQLGVARRLRRLPLRALIHNEMRVLLKLERACVQAHSSVGACARQSILEILAGSRHVNVCVELKVMRIDVSFVCIPSGNDTLALLVMDSQDEGDSQSFQPSPRTSPDQSCKDGSPVQSEGEDNGDLPAKQRAARGRPCPHVDREAFTHKCQIAGNLAYTNKMLAAEFGVSVRTVTTLRRKWNLPSLYTGPQAVEEANLPSMEELRERFQKHNTGDGKSPLYNARVPAALDQLTFEFGISI